MYSVPSSCKCAQGSDVRDTEFKELTDLYTEAFGSCSGQSVSSLMLFSLPQFLEAVTDKSAGFFFSGQQPDGLFE